MTEFQNNSYFVKNTLKKNLTPTIISILSTTMITFVNSLLTGNLYGREALAAMNLINPITFIFAMFGCLISIGGANSASIAMGKEEDELVHSYATLALILSVAVPVIFSAAGFFCFTPLMRLLGANGELYALCEGYGRVILAGGVCTTLMYYPFNFLRVDGRGQYSMMIFGVMGVFDLLFVFVFYRMGMGLGGVAWAVVLSTAAADLLGLGLLFFGKGRQLSLAKPVRVIYCCVQICQTGAAAALNNLCNMLRSVVLNALILSALGNDGVSVFAVACSVLNFAMGFVSGAGQAVAPLVGVFYGERDLTSMRMLMRSSIRYGLILMGTVFAVTVAASVPLAYAFGMREWDMVVRAAVAICWVMFSLIPAAVANSLIFYYMTTDHSMLASVLTFERSFLFVVVFAYLLTALGASGWMLAAFVLGELATLGTAVLFAWLIHLKRPAVNGLLLLEKEDENNRYLSFSVPGSAEGAVGASAKLSEFCETQGMDMNHCMMLPLALEEMLVLVNEHCFLQDASMFADVRILLSQDEVLLRIRCGGKLFDPIADYRKRTAGMSQEELLMDESLGIRMIVEAAKSVTFRRTLGVNNLVVVI